MKSRELELCLQSLKLSRQNLAGGFLQESPSLYSAMFQYETSPSSMEIAQRKFFFEWLISHPVTFGQILQRALESQEHLDRDASTHAFLKSYKALLERFIADKGSGSSWQSDELQVLAADYILSLGSLLEISAGANKKLEVLRYQSEKSKTIFDRTFKELMGGNDGLV
ncbi:hypothetical protein [Metapseudomonas sp. CR1201]